MHSRVGNVGGRMGREHLNTVLQYFVLRNGTNGPSSVALSVPLVNLFCGQVCCLDLCSVIKKSLSKFWTWHIWFSKFLFLKKIQNLLYILFIYPRTHLSVCMPNHLPTYLPSVYCWGWGCRCTGAPQCRCDSKESSFSPWFESWGMNSSGQVWWPIAFTCWTILWTFKVSLYMN